MSKTKNIVVTFKTINFIENEPFQKMKICFLCNNYSINYVKINYIDDGDSVYICRKCIKRIYKKMEGLE